MMGKLPFHGDCVMKTLQIRLQNLGTGETTLTPKQEHKGLIITRQNVHTLVL